MVLVFTFSFNGGTMSSYIQNLINLAPNRSSFALLWCGLCCHERKVLLRSGTLYGISNGFGNITGFLVPEIKKRIVLVNSQKASICTVVKLDYFRTRAAYQNGDGSSSWLAASTVQKLQFSPFLPPMLFRQNCLHPPTFSSLSRQGSLRPSAA